MLLTSNAIVTKSTRKIIFSDASEPSGLYNPCLFTHGHKTTQYLLNCLIPTNYLEYRNRQFCFFCSTPE